MLNRAFSLLFLLSSFSIYPASYVEMVVHGVKNIVIPTVLGAYAGHNALTRRSRDAFFVECAMENRGVSKGVQSPAPDMSKESVPRGSWREAITKDYALPNQASRYSSAGLPMYDAEGRPTEAYYQEQTYRKAMMEKEETEYKQKQQQAAKDQQNRESAAREQYLLNTVKKEWDAKVKASEEGKGLHPYRERDIRLSKMPKELKDYKGEAPKDEDLRKGGGSGGGNNGPEKDPKNDPTKFRKKKGSDLPHPNPAPDPRTQGQSGKDLKFPEKNNPAQYVHQFDKRKGHIQDLTNKARSKLWDCFEKGRFLGQDSTGGFNFDYIDPETGHQLWIRTRPDGKVIDCGSNTVHWELSEHGFLEKPWDLSKELAEGVYYADVMLDNPVAKAVHVVVAAEEWRKDALEKVKDKELSDFLDNVASGFEKREPTAKEVKQRAEADKFSQAEYAVMRKKIEDSRLSKPNPNATIEIAKPARIDEIQPPAKPFKDNIALCPDCGKVVCADCGDHYTDKDYAELAAAFPGAKIPGMPTLPTHSSNSARSDESNKWANERFKQSLKSMSKTQVDDIRARAAASRNSSSSSSSYSSYEDRKAWVRDMESSGKLTRSADGRSVKITLGSGKSK